MIYASSYTVDDDGLTSKPIGTIGGTDLYSAVRYEELNGQDYLDIKTSRELPIGAIIVLESAIDNVEEREHPKRREYVVTSYKAVHDSDLILWEYHCVNSIQVFLSATTCTSMPTNKSAFEALDSILTNSRAVGMYWTDLTTVASASFWRMSGWDALGEFIKAWGGEVSYHFDWWDNSAYKKRLIGVYKRIGRSGVFVYSDKSDLIKSITVSQDDIIPCSRVIPLGAAELVDTGGHGRKITIDSVNGNKPWLENHKAAQVYRGYPEQNPTVYVENPDMTSPAALKAWGLDVLDSVTTPTPTYSIETIQIPVSQLGYVPQLGDSGLLVDSRLDVKMDARVMALQVDEINNTVQATITTGSLKQGALASLVSMNGRTQVSTINALVYRGRATGNFNDLETPGIYYTQNGMTANKPTTANLYAYIEVFSFDEGMYAQTVLGNTGAWRRVKAGNPLTWGAWTAI